MGFRLSTTTLALFNECPRCFWLHFRKGIKRPATVFPSLPSGIDRILKTHFDSFRAKSALPPELEDLDGEVTLFGNQERLDEWRNNFKGIHWEDNEGNILKGVVDELLQKQGKIIVLDFKTRGFPLKDDTTDYYQDQLDIYNFLLRKNGFKTEDYGLLLFYHPEKTTSKGSILFNTELKKLDTTVENAETLFKQALKTLAGEIPDSAEECGFCKWAKATGKGTVNTILQQQCP